MALDDTDMLDRALDAAEARLSEALEDPKEPSGAPEPEDTETPEIEQTEDLVEVVETEKVLKAQTDKQRDKDGKFQKSPAAQAKQKSDQAADVEPVEAPLTGQEPEESPIEMPTFWPAELKSLAAKAPRDLVKKFADYDVQRQQWTNRNAAEAQRGKALEEKLYDGFDRDEAMLHGVEDPIAELKRYRAWDKVLTRDVKAGIWNLMQKNKLTPYDFFEDQNQNYVPVDPRVEQAQADAAEAKRQVEEYRRQVEEERSAVLNNQVEAFKNGKDSIGQVRRPFLDAFEPQIAEVIRMIRQEHPHVSQGDALNHAYEFVLAEKRKLFGAQSAPSPEPQKVVADAKKAKAAAGSITGAPSSGVSGSRPRAKSIDEAMDRAEERLGIS